MIERTLKTYRPGSSRGTCVGARTGDAHGANAANSPRAHSKVAVGLLPVKVNSAVGAYVSCTGAFVIAVSGGSMTVHVQVAGVGSKNPLSSRARTRSVCSPSVSSIAMCDDSGSGGSAASQPSNRPPSSEHSYSTAPSFEEKVKTAPVLIVNAGGPVTIVVSGSWPSTIHCHSSGVEVDDAVGRLRPHLEHVLAVGEARERVRVRAGDERPEVERALVGRALDGGGELEVRDRPVDLALGAGDDRRLGRRDDRERPLGGVRS